MLAAKEIREQIQLKRSEIAKQELNAEDYWSKQTKATDTDRFLQIGLWKAQAIKYKEQLEKELKELIRQGEIVFPENKALRVASKQGDLDDLKEALEEDKAEVNAADEKNDTPLILAARNGRDKCLKYLLKKGANLHQTNDLGRTALHAACENGHSNCVEVLLAWEAKPELKDNNGLTAVTIAFQGQHHDCLMLLGVKPSPALAVNVNDSTSSINKRLSTSPTILLSPESLDAIIEASVKNGDIEAIDKLIAQGAAIERLIHDYALNIQVECVKKLLTKSFDIKHKLLIDLPAKIVYQNKNGFLSVLESLLAKGFDHNQTFNGSNCLSIAVDKLNPYNHEKIRVQSWVNVFSLLFQYPVEQVINRKLYERTFKNVVSYTIKTCFYSNEFESWKAIFALFLAHHASFDEDNNESLIQIITNNHSFQKRNEKNSVYCIKYRNALIELMLPYVKNVNAISDKGRTPLQAAAAWDEDGSCIHLLYNKGADMRGLLTPIHDKTGLDGLVISNNIEGLLFAIRHGINFRDNPSCLFMRHIDKIGDENFQYNHSIIAILILGGAEPSKKSIYSGSKMSAIKHAKERISLFKSIRREIRSADFSINYLTEVIKIMDKGPSWFKKHPNDWEGLLHKAKIASIPRVPDEYKLAASDSSASSASMRR